MKHQMFYSDWSNRINHLESLKHGVFFVHVASLAYLGIHLGKQDFVMWQNEATAIWWLIFSALWFGAIGIMQYHIFRKYLEVAHQLMLIEHLNDIHTHGIHTYSNRADKNNWRSRIGLRLSGLFAEALSILWFVGVALSAYQHEFTIVYWLAVSLGLTFTFMMIAYNIFHSELLYEKDEVDRHMMESSETGTMGSLKE